MAATGAIEVAAVCDPIPEALEWAAAEVPEAEQAETLQAMLALGLDGVAIATPSAQHVGQAVEALDRGVAVFCQKPLGRTEAEARAVVDAARTADRLLAVDLSYRFTRGMEQVRDLVRSGALGHVYAADLVFHNGYGPDKAWFRDPALSGGGCLIDLGVHLVDLALWVLGGEVRKVDAQLFAQGERLAPAPARVEDYAAATLEMVSGQAVRIACSWNLPVGRDAVISASFFGNDEAAVWQNVEGSFYDFTAERHRGTTREELSRPPDDWGGRAAVDWAQRLAAGARHDPQTEALVGLSRTIDRIYGRDAVSPV